MSIFDPHGYYEHKKKSTRKGQVIQKKPWKFWDAKCWSTQELENFIKFLHDCGYKIFDPSAPIPEGITCKVFEFTHFYPEYSYWEYQLQDEMLPYIYNYDILYTEAALLQFQPLQDFINMDRNLIKEFKLILGFRTVSLGGSVFVNDASKTITITIQHGPYGLPMYTNSGTINKTAIHTDEFRLLYLGGVPHTGHAGIVDSMFDNQKLADYDHLVNNLDTDLAGVPFSCVIDTYEDLDKLNSHVYSHILTSFDCNCANPPMLFTVTKATACPVIKLTYILK